VRLLVECIRLEQGLDALPSDPEAVLAQALSHLERAIPRLVLVGGMPGTGKSSLAAWIGEELDATVLSSDRERAEGTGQSLGPTAFGTGPYTFANRRAVYGRLLERASALLSDGASVVVDATWSNRELRQRAVATAAAACADLVELECRCDPALRTKRISLRDRHRLRGESDATPDVADALAAVADPWPNAHTVDTSGTVEASRTSALAALRGGGWAGRDRTSQHVLAAPV
jgi:predicted kinase